MLRKVLIIITVVSIFTQWQCACLTENNYHNSFGIFTDWVRTSKGYNVELSSELGIEVARPFIPWYAVEPTKGRFNFTLADNVIDAHADEGIEMVVTLFSNSDWATDTKGGFGSLTSSMPKNMDEYEEYIRIVVNRYKDKVKYWSIENEIIYPVAWQGTKEEYRELLKTAYAAIKREDPEAKVVVAAFADEQFIWASEGDQKSIELFTYIMRECKDYFDVVDFHQYHEYNLVETQVRMIKETMNRYGYDKEIICTEAGSFDLSSFVTHFKGDKVPIVEKLLAIPEVFLKIKNIMVDGVTPYEWKELAQFLKDNKESRALVEAYQAEDLAKRMSLAFGLGVSKVFWVGIKDEDKNVAMQWFHVIMCLIDKDGRKKPSYYTYRLLIDKLKGFKKAELISNSAKIIKFSFNHKEPVFVIWNNENRFVDLSNQITAKNVKITPIITEQDKTDEHIMAETVNANSIFVGPTPVIVDY